MFQITQFNAMIAEKGYNKTKLAKEINIIIDFDSIYLYGLKEFNSLIFS